MVLVSAVAAAGATLSAQRESWKLGLPRAPRSSPDPSLPAGGQHIRKDSQRGVQHPNIISRRPDRCTKANSGSSKELIAERTAILCCLPSFESKLIRLQIVYIQAYPFHHRYIPSATTDIYSVEADRKPVREGEHSSIHWCCDGPCRSDHPDRALGLGRGRSGSGDSLGLARGEGASVRGAGGSSSVASGVEHSSPSMVR